MNRTLHIANVAAGLSATASDLPEAGKCPAWPGASRLSRTGAGYRVAPRLDDRPAEAPGK